MDQGDRIASPWERKGIGSSGNTGRFSVGLAATNDEAEPITGQRRIRSLSRSGKTTEKENGARKEKSRTNSFLVIFCFIQLPLFGGGRWYCTHCLRGTQPLTMRLWVVFRGGGGRLTDGNTEKRIIGAKKNIK